MAWLYLFAAGIFEIGWAVGLKYTEGFTKLVPTTWTVASMVISLWLLGLALKTLPLGIAWLGEPANPLRLGYIAFIVIGIAGLKMVSPE